MAFVILFCNIFGALSLLLFAKEDLKSRTVPNKAIIFLLVFRIVIYVLQIPFILADASVSLHYSFPISTDKVIETYITGIFGSLIVGGAFLLIAIFSKGSIGFGDVKLMLVIPLYFSLEMSLIGVFIGIFTMFTVSVVNIVIGKWNMKTKFPLVPSLAFGFTVVTISKIIFMYF